MLNKTKEADVGFICDYPLKRHMEGLPVKLFEYMAAGIPVICSNFPLWREIVEKNKCGICVNPLGIKEIAWAINYLIKNPQEAKKMGENGQRAILEQYNWENESKKLLNIYNNLLKD
jgi:glycosyltransferase involved in cell wall biosynthesis